MDNKGIKVPNSLDIQGFLCNNKKVIFIKGGMFHGRHKRINASA